MSIKATEHDGVIDFILDTPGSVKEVHDNTYLHCNFKDLMIVGNYTPVSYHGVKS